MIGRKNNQKKFLISKSLCSSLRRIEDPISTLDDSSSADLRLINVRAASLLAVLVASMNCVAKLWMRKTVSVP